MKKQDTWSYDLFMDCIVTQDNYFGGSQVIGDQGFQCGPKLCISYQYWCAPHVKLLDFNNRHRVEIAARRAEVLQFFERLKTDAVGVLRADMDSLNVHYLALPPGLFPVAATAIPEVVPHGKAGLLVPQRDPVALAEALLKLLTDPELQAQQRAFGRAHVGPYSWDRVAERFLEAVNAAEAPTSAPR